MSILSFFSSLLQTLQKNCEAVQVYRGSLWWLSLVKNTLAMRETWVQSLGWEDPLEKGTATHSSILAWRIPWTVGPWGHKELDMTERLSRAYEDITV